MSGGRWNSRFLLWLRRGAVAMAAVLNALTASSSVAASSEAEVSAETLRAAKPGTIFRIWPLEGGVRAGYKGYRVLYRSTDFNDTPVAVTGAVIFPADPGIRPRDVVAWAHPTTGVVSKCAPTLIPDIAGTIQGIDELTDQGYVIVATDYVGLGTGDHHPYLVGLSAARSVLDSIRAARQLKDVHAGDRFAVWGHSQGGHASLFTGLQAESYAPELKLVGVAAAAPATNLVELFRADRNSSSGRSLTAMAVLSWSRVFDFPLTNLVEADATARFKALASDCIETPNDFFKEVSDEKVLEREFLKIDPTEYKPLRAIMDQNTPGPLPAALPVFLAQGTADELVRPAITRAYMEGLCKAGLRVKLHVMPGGGHMWAGRDSAYVAVQWIGQRFHGAAAPNDC
ncbi:alpha/beta fold hydrolase [Hyphomicrobium sp.]|uniref:alpha/beta fold hydrolase n=1 Tax=Hyphomicrobium sp. TaxID=82 RepID=UPI002E36A074|nr:alpha/beta fold hydrolase [Hyphomicrobium sp.]HEX2842570.1 alpha/beta fold hydrolase [Hyphomicrobium sp.]